MVLDDIPRCELRISPLEAGGSTERESSGRLAGVEAAGSLGVGSTAALTKQLRQRHTKASPVNHAPCA